jgi:hypothetical protein
MVRILTAVALGATACGALAAPSLAAQPGDGALVETAQSKPVRIKSGNVRSVVGQAAITDDGRLNVRLAAPNAAGIEGEDVLAQTSKVIDDEFAGDPTEAHLSVRLKRNRTGTVTVIGPNNRMEPDAAEYALRWSVKKPSIRIVGASAAAAGSVTLKNVCGTARDSGELVTRSGKGSRCRPGVALMRDWRRADNPSRFRSYRCGDVPGTHVEFRGGTRWFASWQCRREAITYRIWTQY